MEIKKMQIEDINPAKYNPRKDLRPGDPEYEKLKKSIQEFNLVEPLVVNKKGDVLVSGHQRLKVLKELGYSELDVSIVDLPEEKEKALNLALNKIEGEWDMDMLADVLQEIEDEFTGFDPDEIADILGEEEEEEEEEPDLEFTEELYEEHNYVVLYFDNEIDWQSACDKLGIESKKALDSREGYERVGTGRVVKGADVIGRIS